MKIGINAHKVTDLIIFYGHFPILLAALIMVGLGIYITATSGTFNIALGAGIVISCLVGSSLYKAIRRKSTPKT